MTVLVRYLISAGSSVNPDLEVPLQHIKTSLKMFHDWTLTDTFLHKNEENYISQLKLAHSALKFPSGVSMTTEKRGESAAIASEWGKTPVSVSKTCGVFKKRQILREQRSSRRTYGQVSG